MFNDVAAGYDVTNNVLSGGNAILWRISTTRALNALPNEKILDLAAGTGTSSAAIAASGAQVVAADFSPGMLAVGRKKHGNNPLIEFIEADATILPFADNSFDATTISFGLRNVQQPELALKEMLRVTKPGGRLVITEFSTPSSELMRSIYGFYLGRVMPLLAAAVSSNPSAYSYLAESIANWPNQKTLARMIRQAGWTKVAYRNLSGGIVTMHRAIKPLTPTKPLKQG